jgi:hypothetical protein
LGYRIKADPPIVKFLRSGLGTRHVDISPKESTLYATKGNFMKRLLLVLFLILGTSLVGVQSASAGQYCADGWYSQSSGSGSCSWHGGIAGGSGKKVDPYKAPAPIYKAPAPIYKAPSIGKTGITGFCSVMDRNKGRC